MKKLVALLLTLCMVLSVMVFASAETLTGSAQGFGSEVKVELTVEDGKIVDLKVKDSGESYPVPRKDSVGKVISAIIEANGYMTLTDYTIACGLSRSSASRDLKNMVEDPTTGIKTRGSHSHKVWVINPT